MTDTAASPLPRDVKIIVSGPTRSELIDEALTATIIRGDLVPGHRALAHHLAKRGLVIVEVAKWRSAKAALMVIGSCGALDGKPAVTALELAADVARRELKKMEA